MLRNLMAMPCSRQAQASHGNLLAATTSLASALCLVLGISGCQAPKSRPSLSGSEFQAERVAQFSETGCDGYNGTVSALFPGQVRGANWSGDANLELTLVLKDGLVQPSNIKMTMSGTDQTVTATITVAAGQASGLCTPVLSLASIQFTYDARLKIGTDEWGEQGTGALSFITHEGGKSGADLAHFGS